MKLKIISDGTKAGTRVVNADTGEEVDDVTRIEWQIDAKGGIASAVMRFEMLTADLILDGSSSCGGVVPQPAELLPLLHPCLAHSGPDIHIHTGGYVPVPSEMNPAYFANIERLSRGRKLRAVQCGSVLERDRKPSDVPEAVEDVDIRGLAPSPGFPALITQPDIHIFYREWAQGGEVIKEVTYQNEPVKNPFFPFVNAEGSLGPAQVFLEAERPAVNTCPHCGQDTVFGDGFVQAYRCGGCERLVG